MTHKSNKTKRPPVVAVMGHIDHGKSSLLDYIRKTNTTAKEAGGITQRMSAYKVLRKKDNEEDVSITFLDTPGHEAFSALRSRGAKVADIAILVVAGDEGVKPQTLEALRSITEANLPYIVAVNKMDKQVSNLERTKQSLAENGIYVEGWGGDIPIVPVSAITGLGIDELLDMVLLLADITDLQADYDTLAEGVVIEAKNSKTKGIGATLILKHGTLKSGMFVVAHDAYAPTRICEDFQGNKIDSAYPSDPISITGFDRLPPVGSILKQSTLKKKPKNSSSKTHTMPKKSKAR